MASRTARRATLFFLIATCYCLTGAQLSVPIVGNDEFEKSDNKFLHRKADEDEAKAASDEEDAVGGDCPLNVELKWMTELSSSIYATPLITDLYSDGRKDILVPSFVHYLEVLEGADGAQAAGWPAFHQSSVHASPLLYDIDFDGVRDVLVATYDGEVLFFKDTADILPEKLVISRLKVRKDWYVGLNPDPIDHTHPDVGDDDDGDADDGSKSGGSVAKLLDAASSKEADEKVLQFRKKMTAYRQQYGEDALRQLLVETLQKSPDLFKALKERVPALELMGVGDPATATGSGRRRLMSVDDGDEEADPRVGFRVAGGGRRRLMADDAGGAAATSPPPPPPPSSTAEPVTQATAPAVPAHVEAAAQSAGDVAKAADGVTAADPTRAGVADKAGAGSGEKGGAADKEGAAVKAEGAAGNTAGAIGTAQAGGKAVGKGEAAGLEFGVESDPKHKLSDEAISTFDLFQDDDVSSEATGEEDLRVQKPAQAASFDSFGDEDYIKMRQASHDALIKSQDSEGADLDGFWHDYEILRHHLVDAANETVGGGDANGTGADNRSLRRQDAKRFSYDEFGDRFVEEEGAGGLTKHPNVTVSDYFREEEMMEAAFNRTKYQMEEDEHNLDKDHYKHMYLGDYGAIHHNALWDDEMFTQSAHVKEQEYVYVDAHVLCTPTIGDIDADGHEELVLAVSFYYEREYYDDPAHAGEVKDLTIGKYIASGIVVFDLRTRVQKWVQHLDLSSDETKFKAFAYSTPTLADINKDGFLEIVVGTSMGFLYVLDHKGNPVAPFPVQMGEIQGQPLVADLNNDGKLEIFAADARGNIACFSSEGVELWERHVHSVVSQGAVAGDVNGDGALEVMFATGSGHVYAVSGSTGLDISNFPFRTHGRIHASPMVTRLAEGMAQHIVIISFDGFMYMIDGLTGCADSVDLGETSYTSVLVDDLDNDGYLDLLATTMNGNVYSFTTAARYHPLKTWPAQGANGLLARHDYFGIFATKSSRQPRDVAGHSVQVQVHVVDKRNVFADNGTLLGVRGGPYNISVMLQGVGVQEMNAGHAPVIGVADTVAKPGIYQLEVPCPRTRSSATIHIELVDEAGLVFVDEFSVSFHLHFHKLLKWLVALPLAMMVGILLVIHRSDTSDEPLALPTYHHLG